MRQTYLDLARTGLRMPIGADLVLHEEPDPEGVKHDAERLGALVEGTARRYRTPLAFPLMDLALEKADLLAFFGVPETETEAYHFSKAPPETALAEIRAATDRPFSERIRANQGAVHYIAGKLDLVPIAMLIGPFSLMTRLMADPISAIALAGSGVTAGEDPDVLLAERSLALATETVLRSARAQLAAGARAVAVCEPAANRVYISPRQLRAGSDIFERFVLAPNRRLRDLVTGTGADFLFHNCGELTTEMVGQFASALHPAVLSLGGSRTLWEDAAVVPKDVVLFGNLPTKTFYSDEAMPAEEVRRRTIELHDRMAACGHPLILASECDVLHVPEAAETIRHKVDVMLRAGSAGF
jgi:uroporphyrinogen-III decarboxylase